MGLLATGTSCFALVWVIGRSRVPAPPARMRPFMAAPMVLVRPRAPAARTSANRRPLRCTVSRIEQMVDVVPRSEESRLPGDAPIELSVVLPCLDEAETLAVCIRKACRSMSALGIAGEVIVADNGSTDGSQEIARAEGARVVDIAVKGYGAALMGGIEAARGEYVVMADADNSYDLERLGPFVEGLRGGADLVMGNRFAGGIEPGAMPALHRYVGNPILTFVGRLFFRS